MPSGVAGSERALSVVVLVHLLEDGFVGDRRRRVNDGGRAMRHGGGAETRGGWRGIGPGVDPGIKLLDLRLERGDLLGERPGALGKGVGFFLGPAHVDAG